MANEYCTDPEYEIVCNQPLCAKCMNCEHFEPRLRPCKICGWTPVTTTWVRGPAVAVISCMNCKIWVGSNANGRSPNEIRKMIGKWNKLMEDEE